MGLAYLPDGRRMPYEEYLSTPEWRKKRADRLAFDNWQCAFCHADLSNQQFQTHHVNYSRLGNEDTEKDIVSLCLPCHNLFHTFWKKADKWETSPYQHWRDYDLTHTAKMCSEVVHEDIFFGGKFNLCSLDTIEGFIDQYFKLHEIEEPARICEEDVRIFIRNKRYELYFEAAKAPEFNLESWLDSMYGQKGIKGGNKIRAEARSFFTKHKPAAMKRIYGESDNLNILMKKVREITKEDKNNAET